MAMPHLGHLPGLWLISPACMGHIKVFALTMFMPHLAHLPGVSDAISGCMGQLNALSFTNTKSIPHLGHLPGLSDVTSGCIGQLYTALAVESVLLWFWAKRMVEDTNAITRNIIFFIKNSLEP